MREQKKNHSRLQLVVGVLVLAAVVASGLFVRAMTFLNHTYNDLNQIEFLSSSTQRLVRLAITDQMDAKVLFFVDDKSTKTLMKGASESLSILDDSF